MDVNGPKVRTILVVDNNRVIVEMVTDFLEGLGYQVEKAYDGMEALDKARRLHPDVIVLDLIMPRIDGVRVCRYLKEDPETSEMPVVILSGTAAEEQVDLSSIGAEAFVAKRRFPEMMESLAEVIRSFEDCGQITPATEVVGGDTLAPRELVRELLDVKRHYDTLIDMVEDGVIEIDRRERVLFANSSALRFLDCLEGELIGELIGEAFPQRERQKFRELLGTISEDGGTSGSLILDLPAKTLKLRAVPLRTESEYDGALITLQDVTAEVRKAKGLERLNRTIIDNIPVGIALVGGNGYIKTLNPIMAAWLGAGDPAKTTGRSLFDFRVEPGRQIAEVVQRLFAKPGLQTGELTVREGGEERMFALVVSREMVVDGDFRGRIVILEDQTERSQLNRRLERINEELLVANQTKGNFISMISHELRTPLTIVEGYLSLLLEEAFGSLAPQMREVMEITKEKADHLHRLIEDLLDVSRIEGGRFLVRMERVDLGTIIDQAVIGVRERASSQGITIVRNLPPAAVHLLSEKSKVYQVIVNLLGNAVKFSEPAGQVTITVEPATPLDGGRPKGWRTIVAGGEDQSEYCCVEVRDEGIGVDPAQLPGIFEIFSQAESGPSRMFTGSGIGLFIVREIITHHRGKVVAWSEPGKGFAVRVSLPLDTPGNRDRFRGSIAEEEERPATPVAGTAKRSTVVLIDDDPDLGGLLGHILPGERFALEVFHDAEGGLRRIAEGGVDLLLLDLKLPGVDGREVCARLRSAEGTARLPILLVTATGQGGEIDRAIEAGANGVLLKPFEPAELLRTVEKLLQEGVA